MVSIEHHGHKINHTLPRREFLKQGAAGTVAVVSVSLAVWQILNSSEHGEKATLVEKMMKDFPDDLKGAELVLKHWEPESETAVVVLLCPHDDYRDNRESLPPLGQAVEKTQENAVEMLNDLESRAPHCVPAIAYAEGIPQGSNETARREELKEIPSSPKMAEWQKQQRAMTQLIYGPLFERWISGALEIQGVEDSALHASVARVEPLRYDSAYQDEYYRLQKERSIHILNVASASSDALVLLQIGPYPHGKNIMEELTMRQRKFGTKALSYAVLIPSGTTDVVVEEEKMQSSVIEEQYSFHK